MARFIIRIIPLDTRDRTIKHAACKDDFPKTDLPALVLSNLIHNFVRGASPNTIFEEKL